MSQIFQLLCSFLGAFKPSPKLLVKVVVNPLKSDIISLKNRKEKDEKESVFESVEGCNLKGIAHLDA